MCIFLEIFTYILSHIDFRKTNIAVIDTETTNESIKLKCNLITCAPQDIKFKYRKHSQKGMVFTNITLLLTVMF